LLLNVLHRFLQPAYCLCDTPGLFSQCRLPDFPYYTSWSHSSIPPMKRILKVNQLGSVGVGTLIVPVNVYEPLNFIRPSILGNKLLISTYIVLLSFSQTATPAFDHLRNCPDYWCYRICRPRHPYPSAPRSIIILPLEFITACIIRSQYLTNSGVPYYFQ
jgi:hypothetical protein